MITLETGRTYLPEGHSPPKTPQQAILAAHALLSEEGRWAQGEWFKNPARIMTPYEFQDNPYCNSWRACMMGAVRIVTVGLSKKQFFPDSDQSGWAFSMFSANGEARTDEAAQLYRQTEALIDGVARESGNGILDGVHYNDTYGRTREEVLNFLTKCAERAEALS